MNKSLNKFLEKHQWVSPLVVLSGLVFILYVEARPWGREQRDNERLGLLKNIYTEMSEINKTNFNFENLKTYNNLSEKKDSIYRLLTKDNQKKADSIYTKIVK